MKAVVLLSGGLDSAVSAWWARALGIEIHALTVDYDQTHRIELSAAGKLADKLGPASHKVAAVHLWPGPVAASVPVTGRNLVLLSMALARCEDVDADAVVIGCNADDSLMFADCRQPFLRSVEVMMHAQHGPRFSLLAPLSGLTKAHVVRVGALLGVPLHLTWSCYEPQKSGVPCGQCGACRLRADAFRIANVADTAMYRGGTE